MPTFLAVHPVLMCSDVAESLRFFVELGFTVPFQDSPDTPRYAVVRRNGVTLHLQWNDLTGIPADQDRPVYRLLIDDVDALFEEFAARSPQRLASPDVTPWHRPAATPWETREFHFHDPDRNGLQFYQPLETPPPA